MWISVKYIEYFKLCFQIYSLKLIKIYFKIRKMFDLFFSKNSNSHEFRNPLSIRAKINFNNPFILLNIFYQIKNNFNPYNLNVLIDFRRIQYVWLFN